MASDVDRQRVWSSLVVAAVFAVSLAGLWWLWTATQSSSAAFADREVFDRNHLGAGTVDIAVGDATARFAAVGMAAGDTADGRLELVNRGTLPLRYSLAMESDSATFDEVFDLVAWVGSTPCDTPPAGARPVRATTGSAGTTIGAVAPGDAQLVCLSGMLPLSAPTSLQGRVVELTILVRAEHDVEATS